LTTSEIVVKDPRPKRARIALREGVFSPAAAVSSSTF